MPKALIHQDYSVRQSIPWKRLHRDGSQLLLTNCRDMKLHTLTHLANKRHNPPFHYLLEGSHALIYRSDQTPQAHRLHMISGHYWHR